MHIVLETDTIYVIRLDEGEELFEQLTAFAADKNITAATISGIGTTTHLTLAWYNPQDKTYIDHLLTDRLEIISLLGNISLKDGKPMAHLHGSFSDYELNLQAGHVRQLIVGATCELVITKLPGTLTRQHQDKWDLDLLQ